MLNTFDLRSKREKSTEWLDGYQYLFKSAVSLGHYSRVCRPRTIQSRKLLYHGHVKHTFEGINLA